MAGQTCGDVDLLVEPVGCAAALGICRARLDNHGPGSDGRQASYLTATAGLSAGLGLSVTLAMASGASIPWEPVRRWASTLLVSAMLPTPVPMKLITALGIRRASTGTHLIPERTLRYGTE